MSAPCPASASSTELSMISHRQCIRPRESVDPMYMPGRLRTASSPSSTLRWRAEYFDDSASALATVQGLLQRFRVGNAGRKAIVNPNERDRRGRLDTPSGDEPYALSEMRSECTTSGRCACLTGHQAV